MKCLFLFTLLFIHVAGTCQTGLLDRVKQKVKARAEQRADETMDKGIDETEEEIRGGGNKKSSETINGDKVQEKKQVAGTPNFKSYSRYDFIPGEDLLYTEDFASDELGELPLHWNTNNQGETVTVENESGKWMRMYPGSRFASPSFKSLPDDFTFELDLLVLFNGEGGYVYPEIEIKMLQLDNSKGSARNFVVNQDAMKETSLVLLPYGHGKPVSVAIRSNDKGSGYFSNDLKELKGSSGITGRIMHISAWVQKERVRYWINGNKIFDVPQAIPLNAGFNAVGFSVESSLYEAAELGIFVSNIKVAEGASDLRKKFKYDGRFATNGILFDVGSDRIKPESMSVLKEIGAILKENSTAKITIVGHTDSDGNNDDNLLLSQKRAAAVKNVLVTEMGVEESNLQIEGAGETKPAYDNATKLGKEKNRRVEFIKH